MKRKVTYLLVLLASLALRAQDTVPLPYFEDWNTCVTNYNSHVANWWFCKQQESPSIIMRSNPHAQLFTRADDSAGVTMASPVFSVRPDSAYFILYCSFLGDSVVNVEYGFIPDSCIITEAADVCGRFVPFDTVGLSVQNVWVQTAVDLEPYYSRHGTSHRIAFRLRNNLYQRVYIDSILLWRKTVHDTVDCHDTICRGDAYSGHGFTVGQEESDTVGTIERWRCDTIGDTAHHYHLLLNVVSPQGTSIHQHLVPGDTLLYQGDTLTQAGTYYYQLTTAYGCDSLVTLVLTYETARIVSDADSVCPGDSVTLTALGTHAAWWTADPPDPSLESQQGETLVTVTPRQSTTYSLSVHEGEEVLAATRIETTPAPQLRVGLSRPFVDYDDPVIVFHDDSPDSERTTWAFSDGTTIENSKTRRLFHHPLPDSIGVTLTSCNRYNCCSDTSFSLPALTRSVWFPNVFTPGEETNNRFGITASFEIVDYELHIYNRMGLLVFHTTDPADLWDGTCNGAPVPQGTYAYHWHVRDAIDYNRTGVGTVTLIR
ncbi:MAG: gliding motility-associated C-terminal domain-containing protein [Bacteroidales bacterium]|nr:gliding motility-associated C-terminal domain-containing protein [Bacteroidales bacterium]